MTSAASRPADASTAAAFASSWNNLPAGSVYTPAQFEDWLAPLQRTDCEGRRVLELGCGNGSLLVHMARWQPGELEGVDLGDSVRSASANLVATGHGNARIVQGDLTTHTSNGFDLVYCIGVLHHLKAPKLGLDAVVRNTRPGGRFHCWVYGHEGNSLVRLVVEPTRRIASKLPWWVTKYGLATPMVAPYFVYAKVLCALAAVVPPRWMDWLPLFAYSRWIGQRGFLFFRHVAFDQLVTPQTVYLRREQIEAWLASYPEINPASVYVLARNGNSWKFGAAKLKSAAPGLSGASP